MKSTRRNDPCPCGSGSKYKHCCEDKDKQPFISRTGLVLGLAIAVVLAGGVAALFNDPSNDAETERKLRDVLRGSSETAPPVAPATANTSTTPPAATPQAPAPQPPGPAPAGKVWSAEHGHWHAAPSVQVQATRTGGLTASATPGPPPAAPAQEPSDAPQPGTVWNEEHGHYHKVDPAATEASSEVADGGDVPVTSVPRAQIPRIQVGQDGVTRASSPIAPPGPAPEGKVWSYEHGHWHDALPAFPSGDYPEDDSASESKPDQNPQ